MHLEDAECYKHSKLSSASAGLWNSVFYKIIVILNFRHFFEKLIFVFKNICHEGIIKWEKF